MNITILLILSIFITESTAWWFFWRYHFICGKEEDIGVHECIPSEECLISWYGKDVPDKIQHVTANKGDCTSRKCKLTGEPTVCCNYKQRFATTQPPTTISTTELPTIQAIIPLCPAHETEECNGICVPHSKCIGINLLSIYKDGCINPDDANDDDPYRCCEVEKVLDGNDTSQDIPLKCFCKLLHNCTDTNPYLGICDNLDVLCCEVDEEKKQEMEEEEKRIKAEIKKKNSNVKCTTSMGKYGLCVDELNCQDANSSKEGCKSPNNVCCELTIMVKKKCACLPEDQCKVPIPHLGSCPNSEVPCCEPKNDKKKTNSKMLLNYGNNRKDKKMLFNYENNRKNEKMLLNYGNNRKRSCLTSNGFIRDCTPYYLCNDWNKQLNVNCNFHEVCCENPQYLYYRY